MLLKRDKTPWRQARTSALKTWRKALIQRTSLHAYPANDLLGAEGA